MMSTPRLRPASEHELFRFARGSDPAADSTEQKQLNRSTARTASAA